MRQIAMLGSDELIKNRRHITQTLRYYPSTVFKYLSPAGSLSRGDFFRYYAISILGPKLTPLQVDLVFMQSRNQFCCVKLICRYLGKTIQPGKLGQPRTCNQPLPNQITTTIIGKREIDHEKMHCTYILENVYSQQNYYF